ncbi:MAG: alkaline phosphatase family protein [Halorhabdus sp.]
MTVVVLAIDAIDQALVDYFDLDELRLQTDREIETFNYAQKVPYTPEVWTTVATGLPVEEHDVKDAGTSQWSNPLLELASKITGRFPEHYRYLLGQFVKEHTDEDWGFGTTDLDTLFDSEGHYLHNWPGINNTDVDEVNSLYQDALDAGLSNAEFDLRLYTIAAQEFEWVEEMLRSRERTSAPVNLLGVHTHILDAAGHIYADDERHYRQFYEWVAARVEKITDLLHEDDSLILLGDHGMEVEFLGDATPGQHSWRPHVASTEDSVPSDVENVRGWVEQRVSQERHTTEEMDVPEDRLRELGYI